MRRLILHMLISMDGYIADPDGSNNFGIHWEEQQQRFCSGRRTNQNKGSEPMKTQATARVISDREFVLEHTFKAPAAKVFAAMVNYEAAAGAKMAWDRLAELMAEA